MTNSLGQLGRPRQDPRYLTDEVRQALAERQLTLIPEPDQPAVPDGHLRYHLAVEQTVLSGTAPPSVVATVLRGLADVIDTTPKEHHG